MQRRQKQETGKPSQKTQLLPLLCLYREKRYSFGKPRLQRRPKQSCRPSDSEWRHPGAVAKVSLILSHKDLPGLEHKPPAMRKPNQDSSIKIRQTVWSFCAFAEKNAVSLAKPDCKGGKSVGRNDRLWHLKSPCLPKASSQSPRIQLALNSVIRMPISNKEGTAYGGPGVLWHPKSRYLPKPSSQSLRIPLWHPKSPDLSKAPSQSPEFSLR